MLINNDWFYRNYAKHVTCLCRTCVEFYFGNPEYFLKRLTPPNGPKENCDRCNRPGFDYVVCEMTEYYAIWDKTHKSHNGRRAE